MKRKFTIAIFTATVLALNISAADGGGGFFSNLFKSATSSPAAAAVIPGQEELVAGLKEALSNGVATAVSALHIENGFLTNLDVKIEIPQKLAPIEKTLRTLGQGYLLDEFMTNMNRAAEIAVGEVTPIFVDAVKNMSIADAQNILKGPNDAATEYFRKTSEVQIQAKMLPLIQEATGKAGATATYKTMMDKAGSTFSFLKTFQKPFDLDAYVNQKASDGLFKMIAAQEKKIRENPAGQASDLLKKVFGNIGTPQPATATATPAK